MSRTSSDVKNRYNKKNYDRINLVLKKGEKERIQQKSEALGYPSVNSFIIAALSAFDAICD